jgi:hypothetical protein
MLAPSWPGYLKMPEVWVDQRPNPLEDELATKGKSPSRVRHELYTSLYDAFHDAGSDDFALVLKVSLMSRMPGHKKLVERAYREARQRAA